MGMDHRYGSCPLKGYGSWVWIMGYGSHVLPGYGSEPYSLSRSHIICSNVFYEVVRHGASFVKVAHRSVGFSCDNALLRQFELRKCEKEAMNQWNRAPILTDVFPCISSCLAVTISNLVWVSCKNPCQGFLHIVIVSYLFLSHFPVAFFFCRGTYALFSRSTHCLFKDVRRSWSFGSMI